MRDAWTRLQPRERRLVGIAAVLVALVLAWMLIWEPLRETRSEAARQVATQRALLDWLDRLAPQVRAARDQDGPDAGPDPRSTLAMIDDTARAAGLAGALRRIEPAAGGEVRVDFEGAPFPGLMGWLAGLTAEHPMAVVRMTADRSAAGRVDATVVLRRDDAGTGGGPPLLE
jgi:general secretion pathway protein M